ncbi:Uncharacterised protein [uncultured Leptotrichia sp.]|uniref:hypothetical protein n=1 Tax=uncultured Leptotrichia sp. TaxID=159271 RepID=UPI001A54E856|nr:hypothetical protein [uncultured Leptotrichia sp.]VTX68775.1 Uncharacterised protein [uncultured Leptotrichia sp.]
MRKIIFLILSVFVISNLGFSKVVTYDGIAYDYEIFGARKHCKVIGSYYIILAGGFFAQELLGEKHPELIKRMKTATLIGNAINEQLLEEGYDYGSSFLDNINYYYKNNCRIAKEGEIVADEKNYFSNQVVTYFNTMMKIFFKK